MSTFCSMPQICMHHLLPVSLRACLPGLVWPGQDGCSCSCSHIVVACMSHAWPSLRPCGSVRQYPPSAAESGPICGFWAAAISCLLPGQLSLALSHRAVLAASLTIVCFVLRWFELLLQASLATGSHSNLGYVEPIKINNNSIHYLLDYKDL